MRKTAGQPNAEVRMPPSADPVARPAAPATDQTETTTSDALDPGRRGALLVSSRQPGCEPVRHSLNELVDEHSHRFLLTLWSIENPMPANHCAAIVDRAEIDDAVVRINGGMLGDVVLESPGFFEGRDPIEGGDIAYAECSDGADAV